VQYVCVLHGPNVFHGSNAFSPCHGHRSRTAIPTTCAALVGEIEYLEVDRYTTDAATNLEWIDTFIDEVTEELSPRALLPVGGIPDTRFAGSVVSARPRGRVGTGHEGVPR
jgi:hypothetical protein